MPTVDAGALRDHVVSIFVAADVPAESAQVVADHLVEANLKGHDSHGVIRVVAYLRGLRNGSTDPHAEIVVERETETTAVIDGGWNFGQLVARTTMAVAIEKAKRAGVAVAVAHRSTHVGRLGAYSEQAAAAGLIGIAMVNNHGGAHAVAPFGGAQARLSTNPMTFGFPTSDADAPVVLDMATSVVAAGKLMVARNKGATVPEGWLLDARGRPTTDPNDFLGEERGALLPVGGDVGYKGFGLSIVVEALAGALSPAGTSRPDPERGGNALFTLAIDPGPFGGLASFAASMDVLIDWVKRPPFQDGVDEVLVAGEPERRMQAQREAGGVPLDDGTWTQLSEAAASVGVEELAVNEQR